MKIDLGAKQDKMPNVAHSIGYDGDGEMQYPCLYLRGIEGAEKLKPGTKVVMEGIVKSRRTTEEEGGADPEDTSIDIRVTTLKTAGGGSTKIDNYKNDPNKDEINKGLDEATGSNDDEEEEEE